MRRVQVSDSKEYLGVVDGLSEPFQDIYTSQILPMENPSSSSKCPGSLQILERMLSGQAPAVHAHAVILHIMSYTCDFRIESHGKNDCGMCGLPGLPTCN